MDNKRNLIAIIGNGCAGAECIRTLRESRYPGEIHLFTDSSWPVCNPMLTTYYLAGKIDFAGMFPYGSGDEFLHKYQVDVHPGSAVTALNSDKRVVANQAGFELRYDQCLVASGANPIIPPGLDLKSGKVFQLRTAYDAMSLKEAVDKKPAKVLIVGASMIGIKLAELFHHAVQLDSIAPGQ